MCSFFPISVFHLYVQERLVKFWQENFGEFNRILEDLVETWEILQSVAES